MTQDIVIGEEELNQKFAQLSEVVQGQTLVMAVSAGALIVEDATLINIQSQGLIKTRTLSRSIHQQVVEQSNDRAVVDVGTNLESAAIHEFGGTIRAKNSKYLAIPVGSYVGSPRNHSDLILRKTKRGTLVLMDAGGSVQYVLKESVEIPARPYLRPAADEHHEQVQNEIAEVFKIAIEGVVR